jgi:ATP-dependent DNA helicase RecG
VEEFRTKLYSEKKKAKPPQWSAEITQHGLYELKDLLWFLPTSLSPILKEDEIDHDDQELTTLLKVTGRLSHVSFRPLFFRKGKGPLLHHSQAVFTSQNHHYKVYAFNQYPTSKKKWNDWAARDSMTLVANYSKQNGFPSLYHPKEFAHGELSEENNLEVNYPVIKNLPTKQWEQWRLTLNTEPMWQELHKHYSSLQNTNMLSYASLMQQVHGFQEKNPPKLLKESLVYYELCFDYILKERKRLLRKKQFTSPLPLIPWEQVPTPFPLTDSQKETLNSIWSELTEPSPTRLLLQADVGAGKSIIAFATFYAAIKKDPTTQCALMAPTETLLQQHKQNWKIFFPDAEIAILTGKISKKEKSLVLEQIAHGKIQLIFGTHALFQEDVQFKNLRLIIIDEQQRYGVGQRQALYDKGIHPHMLMLSATPIPRSLAQSAYGDLEQLIMQGRPQKNYQIKSRVVAAQHFQAFLNFVRTRLEKQEQVYFVSPVIHSSEHYHYSIQTLVDLIQEHFPTYSYSVLHGELSDQEQSESFTAFKEGKTNVLVATTMIEVGIDVHNATVMSIFHAKAFGMSTLHQLRGRVGRGGKPGFCFFVHLEEKSSEENQRLALMESTTDGFVIAQKDLEWRGSGNYLGKEQSGVLRRYKIADPSKYEETAQLALEKIKSLKISEKDAIIIPRHLGVIDKDNPLAWI